MDDDNVQTEDLDEGEWRQFHAGGHFIQVWVTDGIPRINIRDHAQIAVEGGHKDNPLVVVGENEFPTRIRRVSESAFWERYNETDSSSTEDDDA